MLKLGDLLKKDVDAIVVQRWRSEQSLQKPAFCWVLERLLWKYTQILLSIVTHTGPANALPFFSAKLLIFLQRPIGFFRSLPNLVIL